MRTTRQSTQQKLEALRGEAIAHDDFATVALVDRALAGDGQAATKLGVAAKAVRAASTGAAARAPRVRRRSGGINSPAHPWAHDEE